MNVRQCAFHPGFQEGTSYSYALVALEEGPNLGANIVGCDPSEVYIRTLVEMIFRDVDPGDAEQFTIMNFRLSARYLR